MSHDDTLATDSAVIGSQSGCRARASTSPRGLVRHAVSGSITELPNQKLGVGGA